jgi:hypothetical protein
MRIELAVLPFNILSGDVDDCLVGAGCSRDRGALLNKRLAVQSPSGGMQMLKVMRPSFAHCLEFGNQHSKGGRG